MQTKLSCTLRIWSSVNIASTSCKFKHYNRIFATLDKLALNWREEYVFCHSWSLGFSDILYSWAYIVNRNSCTRVDNVQRKPLRKCYKKYKTRRASQLMLPFQQQEKSACFLSCSLYFMKRSPITKSWCKVYSSTFLNSCLHLPTSSLKSWGLFQLCHLASFPCLTWKLSSPAGKNGMY